MIDGDSPADDGQVMDDVFDSGRDRGGDVVPSEGSSPPRDEHGRFAPRQEAAPEPAPVEGQPDPEIEPDEVPEQGESIPRSAFIAERKKLQARIEQIERTAQERELQYQQQLRQLQQPQQWPQQQPEPLDIFEDPEGFFQQKLTPIQQEVLNTKLDMSEDRARERYGDDLVNEAFAAVQRAGIAQQFVQSRHAYGDIVKWYQREKTLAEVGTNPDEYRKKLSEEIRAEVLKELKAGGAPGQQPPRFPTSLADQTNAGRGTGAVVTPDAIMSDIFNPDRNRRS